MGRRGRSRKRAVERAEAQQQREMRAQFVAAQLSYWSGPTPSPDVLREYDEIVPGSADRIIAMAEKQSEHRQELEKIAVSGGSTRALLGSIFAFIIGMTAILGGIYLAVQGQELGGYSMAIGTIATLAGVFVYGRKSARGELTAKAPSGEAVGERG